MDLFKFMKNWTLPLAMLAGVIGYFVFANFTFLEPTKPFMNGLNSQQPAMPYSRNQLFWFNFTECKQQLGKNQGRS